MSDTSHSKSTHQNEEHGTTESYIIGFVLSLVFTAIPYYLVVNQSISGTQLLITILGIAVLQMIIQIVFFLHLGRGPKPLYNIVFFVSTVGIILVVVVGSVWIMNHLNYNMAPTDMAKYLVEKEGIYQIDGQKTGACQGQYTIHKVTINGNEARPNHVEAQFCDTITFINENDTEREIIFGTHSKHESYAGHTKLKVRWGRAKSIKLNEAGTYQFHDHLDPEVTGSFIVTPR